MALLLSLMGRTTRLAQGLIGRFLGGRGLLHTGFEQIQLALFEFAKSGVFQAGVNFRQLNFKRRRLGLKILIQARALCLIILTNGKHIGLFSRLLLTPFVL